MECFSCNNKIALRNNTLCLECTTENGTRERTRLSLFRQEFVTELEQKIATCDGTGWPRNTPESCKIFLSAMSPGYTPKKDFENTIKALQK